MTRGALEGALALTGACRVRSFFYVRKKIQAEDSELTAAKFDGLIPTRYGLHGGPLGDMTKRGSDLFAESTGVYSNMQETYYATVVLEGSSTSVQINCQAQHSAEARTILNAQYRIKTWLAGPNRQKL